ncbi:acyl-CoA dehydrogenase family protein, partial [Candidatus Riflebacteria bacterium]
MKLTLSDSQNRIKSEANEFAREHLEQLASELDAKGTFPAKIIELAAEKGYMGIAVPRENGGWGADYVSYVAMIEEISRYCASTGVILSVNNSLVCEPLMEFGTDEQKENFLKPLAYGQKLGCFALTEANAGSDCGKTKTTAKADGDNWIITGSKMFITCGTAADIAIVFALTSPDVGSRGISAFLVETDSPGFSAKHIPSKMGIKASGLAELVLEDVKVPGKNILGPENKGFKVAMKTLDAGRIGIAAQAVGIAKGAFEETISIPPLYRLKALQLRFLQP